MPKICANCPFMVVIALLITFGLHSQAVTFESRPCTSALSEWKLVRDNMAELYGIEGSHYRVSWATSDELVHFLLQKYKEELEEFQKSPSAEEMADLFEVSHALMTNGHLGFGPELKALTIQYGFNFAEIEKIRARKFMRKGGFTHGVLIHAPWIEKIRASRRP